MKVVTARQMRDVESRAGEAGVSAATLMETAGLRFADCVRRHMGGAAGSKVVVLVGPGNNGGDGLVAARHLHEWGASVTVYLCGRRPAGDGNLAAVGRLGLPVIKVTNDPGYDRLREALRTADAAVDSILGTGRSRPIAGVLLEVLAALSEAKAARESMAIVALDLPTGLDSDTGETDAALVRADLTVTLGYPKRGLFAYPGAEAAGTVETVDIGVPAGLDGDVDLELMTAEWAAAALPPRPSASHKGTFGRALVVAGSARYVGAAALAASAAGRVGAGLVTVAVPRSLQMAVAAAAPEPTYIPLPESTYGEPADDAAELVLEALPDYDALLVGCGLGQSDGAARLLGQLLYGGAALPPAVVDADGLNFLARFQPPDWWERMDYDAVLTPHPGEMGRLSGNAVGELQRDRVGSATDAARRWGKTVVLKGAYTVVASADGSAMLSPFANPALASAGTGDVLAGAVTGLLAQGLDLRSAAALGVYLHGAAAELVSEDLGDAGLLAGDLLPALPRAIRNVKDMGRRGPHRLPGPWPGS